MGTFPLPFLSLPSTDSSAIRHPSFTVPLPSPQHKSRMLPTSREVIFLPMTA